MVWRVFLQSSAAVGRPAIVEHTVNSWSVLIIKKLVSLTKTADVVEKFSHTVYLYQLTSDTCFYWLSVNTKLGNRIMNRQHANASLLLQPRLGLSGGVCFVCLFHTTAVPRALLSRASVLWPTGTGGRRAWLWITAATTHAASAAGNNEEFLCRRSLAAAVPVSREPMLPVWHGMRWLRRPPSN